MSHKNYSIHYAFFADLEKRLYGKRVFGAFTGSYLIVENPNDIDYILPNAEGLADKLVANGWAVNDNDLRINYPNASVAIVARKGEYNIIVPRTPEDYRRWVSATELMVGLNLTERDQRKKLFQFLTEGRIRETGIRLFGFKEVGT